MLLQDVSISYRFATLLSETTKGRFKTSELGIRMTAEVLGGGAAIIFGILTPLHIASTMLMSVSAIVFGATLIFGSGIMNADHGAEVLMACIGEGPRSRDDRGRARGKGLFFEETEPHYPVGRAAW
jgi:hypothetical protein